MATKKDLKADPVPLSSDATGYEDFEDHVDEDKIRQVLESHDVSGGSVRIERKGPFDQTYQYIVKMPIEQFDIDHIKKTFGGGDYRGKAHRADGKMFKSFDFAIDYRFKGALDEQEIKSIGKGTGSTPESMARLVAGETFKASDMFKLMEITSKQQETSMMLMMKMLTDSQERQMMIMQQMFTAVNNATANVNRPAVGSDFGTAITPILLEMIRSKSNSSPMSETIAMMKQLKEYANDGKQDGEEPSFFEKLMHGIAPILLPAALGPKNGHSVSPGPQRVLDRRPGMGPGPGMGSQMGPGIGSQMGPGIGSQMGPVPDSQTQPMSGQVQQPQQTSAEQQDPLLNVNIQVRFFMGQLLAAAERGSDPGLYCDLICDTLNETQLVQLREALKDAQWLTKLFGNQDVSQYLPWLEELREMILNPATDIPGVDPQQEPSPGEAEVKAE